MALHFILVNFIYFIFECVIIEKIASGQANIFQNYFKCLSVLKILEYCIIQYNILVFLQYFK